jgi:hypothetical protein
VAVTINDLRQDWEHARDELGRMIEFMERPGTGLTSYWNGREQPKENWLTRLRADRALYDELLCDYPAIR